ncbi:MAG TPA: UDP-N-acetylmuramate dehydrogenase [Terriglobales bacterium]|jgi:UDP-N-acetylmuramate dehydrogenase|nr:UDP-N-acetylmuramate dehydrogenase [Terriglobales bacterium]
MSKVNLEILENVPLAPLTTLGVGGNARFFVRAHSLAELEPAIAFALDRQLNLFILGGGSNLVISDRGFDGLVLQIAVDGIEERRTERAPRPGTAENAAGAVVLDVGAGVLWDAFVSFCVSKNYGGIECLSGIPGNVGGTPVQNVGAYGQEVSDTIVSVLVYDLHERCVRELQKVECGFSYRASVFNSTHRGRYIIALVTYALQPGAPPALRYADLRKHFQSKGNRTLGEVRDAVLKIRASKGMVINPNDPDSRSAGSFFKNPVLSDEQFAELEQKAAARGLEIPRYPALSQQHKIPAAWLVENSGFHKGFSLGAVGISTKHTLAIVNRGGARAAEIIALRDEIQSKVERTWGVELDPEPVFVGF